MFPLRHEKRLFVLVFVASLCLIGAIVLAGYLQWLRFERHWKRDVERRLSAIAASKAQEIASWRQDRIRTASFFEGNETFFLLVRRFVEDPTDFKAREDLENWLRKAHAAHGYDCLCLYDEAGAARIQVPEESRTLPSVLPPEILARARAATAFFDDFCPRGPKESGAESGACLAILVPVRMPANDSALAILGLAADLGQVWVPERIHWPVPGEAGELLLVRRQGDRVLCLNGVPAGSDGAARTAVFGLERVEVPAVQAVLGRQGVLEGPDARREPRLGLHASGRG